MHDRHSRTLTLPHLSKKQLRERESSSLQLLLIIDKRLQPLHKLLLGQLLALPHLVRVLADLLGWDEHVADDLDDAVLGDAVGEGHVAEAVDLDVDQAAVAADVDGEVAVVEGGGEVDLFFEEVLVGFGWKERKGKGRDGYKGWRMLTCWIPLGTVWELASSSESIL